MRFAWRGALGVVVTGVALAAAGVACGKFDGGAAVDGGGDAGSDPSAGPVESREVTVVAEWPTEPTLDPSRDARAASYRLVLTDDVDARRTLVQALPSRPEAPVRVTFEASARVTARFDVVGNDGRVLGLGAARLDLRAAGPHPVAVRRRLLYVAALDRGSGPELKVLDLADPDTAEGDLPTSTRLASFSGFSGLHVTDDGRSLVGAEPVLGPRPSGGGQVAVGGALVVVDTASHAITRHPLAFGPGALAPLDDTHVLVAPGGAPGDTVLRVVDVRTGAAAPLPSGLQGGTLEAAGASRSPDGGRIVVTASYAASATARPRPTLVLVDVASRQARPVDLSGLVDGLGAARFVPGSGELVVVGWTGSGDASVGRVLVFDERVGAPVRQLALPAPAAEPSSVFVHPDGRHAFVTTAMLYPAGGGCCGGVRIVDLAGPAQISAHGIVPTGGGGSSAEWRLDSAIALPEIGGRRRVIGGASDNGNDAHGPFADLGDPASGVRPLPRTPSDYGSLAFLASPFAEPL